MKRIVGFALFWVAAGMVLALVLPGLFCQILCIILCIAVARRTGVLIEKCRKNLENNTCFCENYLLVYYCCESEKDLL